MVQPAQRTRGRQGHDCHHAHRSGTTANLKGLGGGVAEYKIDFGPGYRVYFGKDGDRRVILLGGGTKKRQRRDIEAALAHWQGYKRA